MTDPRTGPSRPVRSTPGRCPTAQTGARALPIYQTTSYVFKDTDARGEPVRAQGVREHLHPDHEPDAGRRRAADRGARGRRRGAARRVRAGRGDAGLPQRRRGRRPHRGQPVPLRRHVQPAEVHAARSSASRRTFVEDPDDARGVAGRRPAEHQGCSSARPSPTRRRRSSTSRASPASPTRSACRSIVDNTIATPYLHPPAGVGRRRRHPLGDQVPRRPRHVHRRRHRRRRDVRLRQGPGEVPELQHARGELPRAGVRPRPRRGRDPRGQPRVHPQGARPAAARPRRGDLAVQRVPHRAGRRDAVAAHRAAHRERPQGRRVPEAHPQVETVRVGVARRRARARRSPRSTRPAGAGAVLAFEIAGGLEAGQAVRRGPDAAQPRGQHRRRALAGHPPGVHDALARAATRTASRPASRRAWCASRSASSTSTTSSPTSTRASPRRRSTDRAWGRAGGSGRGSR